MWSVGCIFAELLGNKPLFKGRDCKMDATLERGIFVQYLLNLKHILLTFSNLSPFSDVDQLNQILGILGTPDDATLKRIGSERAQLYIRSLPKMKKVPWTQLYPKASPTALDLLERLLTFDPAVRITVEEALSHPYLEAYHDIEDEVSCWSGMRRNGGGEMILNHQFQTLILVLSWITRIYLLGSTSFKVHAMKTLNLFIQAGRFLLLLLPVRLFNLTITIPYILCFFLLYFFISPFILTTLTLPLKAWIPLKT